MVFIGRRKRRRRRRKNKMSENAWMSISRTPNLNVMILVKLKATVNADTRVQHF